MVIAVRDRGAIGPSEMANARHFRVSPRFVNDMIILKRESGGLFPKAQGNHADGKPAPYAGCLQDRLAAKGDLTLDEIVVELAAVHGLSAHRGSVGEWLHRLGPSHKKNAARQRNPSARGRGTAKDMDRNAPVRYGQHAGKVGVQ